MDMVFWSILLLVLGLLLIVLEVFVPSAGLLSCLSALAVAGSLVLAFVESMPFGVGMLGVTAVALPVAIVVALKWWPRTPIGRLILIQRPKSPDDVLPETEQYRGLEHLIGRRGKARCDMMPSGVVRIDNRTYDAVADGVAIDAGESVEVIDVRTHRIIVRPVRDVRPPRVDDPSSDDVLSQPIDSLGLDDPLT